MSTLVRNILIVLAVLGLSLWATFPTESKLRKGKDLAGGASLVYSVDVKPGEVDVLPKVISVIKDRLDPSGVMEISVVGQGDNRIEISMPLPNDEVKSLRSTFDEKLQTVSQSGLTGDEFDRIVTLAPEARRAEFARIAAGDVERATRLEQAAKAFDDMTPVRGRYVAARSEAELARQAFAKATTGSPEEQAAKDLLAAKDKAVSDLQRSLLRWRSVMNRRGRRLCRRD
jgi:SecD/SecF fusion protein